MSYFGGGTEAVAEFWSARIADVWISQQTGPYCKI